MSGVRALLWDADGVLQHPPRGWNWRRELDRVGGPGFSDLLFEAEVPALRGEESLRDAIARLLFTHPQTSLGVDDLMGLWEMTEPDPAAFELVDAVRERGVLTVLATNQQDHRRAWMRDVLHYDAHFDAVFYSCELGVAKPDPRFFEVILSAVDLPASAVGFVDDAASNVQSADQLGIATYHHRPESGISALRAGVEALLAGGRWPSA